jgi:hypothetical protein
MRPRHTDGAKASEWLGPAAIATARPHGRGQSRTAMGTPHLRHSPMCLVFCRRFLIVIPSCPDVAVNRGVCRREGLTAGSGLSMVWVSGRVNHACDRMRLPSARR